MSDQAQPHSKNMSSSPQQLKDIADPHDHDVLSGRGNFVNYHAGNEYFRALVRKHKVAYVACPKPQKATFSRLIVDEVRARDPPGRFLKQDPKTKLWYDIGDKKALDKTRQALREGAPELLKELTTSDEEQEASPQAPVGNDAYVSGVSTGLGTEAVHAYATSGAAGYPESTQSCPPKMTPHMVTFASNSMPPAKVSQPDARIPTGTMQSMPVAVGSMNPSAVDNSARPVQMSNQQDAVNIADATENLEALQKQLAAAYSAEQFEPTPLDPNLPLQIREAQAQLNALQQQLMIQQQHLASSTQTKPRGPPLSRDDSLKFGDIFPEGRKGSSKTLSSAETQEASVNVASSVLSGMSFSAGDLTVSEESTLSAVFEDSVRISDAPKSGSANGKLKTPKAVDAKNNQSMNLDSFDMSALTFGESHAQLGSSTLGLGGSTLGGSTMQMSFSRVFDESSEKK